jgi:hypothetical protein
MKTAWTIAFLSIILFTACQSTEDVLNTIDHTVPSILFTPDSLDVTAGETIVLNAVIEDESGLQRIEFTYGDWRINKIVDLTEETGTESYTLAQEITVPVDAMKEWEESFYYNDGSSIKITQRYHRLALSAWDKNRNLVKRYCYIKVK